MPIRRYQPSELTPEFNRVLSCDVYPWEGLPRPPFGACLVTIEPGGHTQEHSHPSCETFFIMDGAGTITIDNQTTAVARGDVIYLVPGSHHILRNTSDTVPLQFVDIFWDGTANEAVEARTGMLVLPAEPTPNGRLHLGHLSGPYLAADVIRRYQAMRGRPAAAALMVDDHQTYVEFAGPPAEVAKQNGMAIAKALKAAGVLYDGAVQPHSNDAYKAFVLEQFRQLPVEDAEGAVAWCAACQRYLHDAFVMGRCPHCERDTYGFACEACGLPQEPLDPVCRKCEAPADLRTVSRPVFRLAKYREALAEWHAAMALSPRLAAVGRRLLELGPPDIPVTQFSNWGIAVADGVVISPWLETALAQPFMYGALRTPLSDPFDITYCFGFDNAFVYMVLNPAVALAQGRPLARHLISNDFLTSRDGKFSTSRGHAIWLDDFLGQVPADLVRFYLAWVRPEHARSAFSIDELQDVVNAELLCGWQSWLRRLGGLLERGQAPEVGRFTAFQNHYFGELWGLSGRIAECYEPATFSLRRAARLLCEVARGAADMGAAHDALQPGPERRNAIALELAAARSLAILAAPLMPQFAARLWQKLGYGTPLQRWDSTPQLLPPGQQTYLSKALSLFPESLNLQSV